MSKLIREQAEGGRLHIDSPLMGESLVSRALLAAQGQREVFRMHPDVNVLKIGGQSIMDRGAKALLPIIDVLLAAKEKHKLILMTGGGTRARHIYNIGLELGMPTGVLAKFGNSISEQNALLVSMLLAPFGGIKIGHDEIVKLTSYFVQGCIPVMHGMPPYDYFAIPPAKGRIPIHRTDVGTIIMADLIGARKCIFIKDEKGLYTGDPKKNPNERFIPEIGAKSLIEKDQDDLIIERPCLEILQNSEVMESIVIIDGLEAGNITRALNGESVGTVIYKE